MYLIQGIFKNGNCDIRIYHSYIRNTEEDIVNYINSVSKLYECDISPEQSEEIQIEMARHWNHKERNDEESFNAILSSIKLSSAPLTFPYLKICNIRKDGSISKPLHACMINNRIYILKDRDKKGVFHTLNNLNI